MIHWTLDIPTLVLHVTHHLTHDMIWILEPTCYSHPYVYVYICMYTERERERERHT